MIQLIFSSKPEFNTLKILEWISFTISILNIFILFFHCFINSIFLAPIDFIPTSLLDIYDGKTNTIFFILRLVVILSSYFIYIATDIMYIILIAILIFIFCLTLFYMRVMTVLHVSFVGAYFELAPFFCFPFEIVLQYGYSNKWYLVSAFLLLLHALFILTLKAVNLLMKKEAKKIFSVLVHKNEEEEDLNELENNLSNDVEIPSFASGNVISGLRIMALYHGDPQFFKRFALIQHRSGVRASPMLEIIRFLGIFPSKRREMLSELKSLKSSSNYNRFMIYFFSKVLRSLVNPCKDKNKDFLNFYQRSFIIHNHFFWLARNQEKIFKTFSEVCAVCYFYYEYRLEIYTLISRFYFDSSLYRRFGEFLLLARGDYENSVFYQKFADSIDNNEVKLTDNLIHRYIKFNPRILRFLNEDEYKSSSVKDSTLIERKILNTKSDTFLSSTNRLSTSLNSINRKIRRRPGLSVNNTNSSLASNSVKNANESVNAEYSVNSEFNYSNDNTLSLITPSPLTTATSNASAADGNQMSNGENCEEYIEKPVVSFLQASNRPIPLFPFINNIIACVLVLVFLFRIIPIENKLVNSFIAIEDEKPKVLRLFVDTGNSIFFPISMKYEVTDQNTYTEGDKDKLNNLKNIIDSKLMNLHLLEDKEPLYSLDFSNLKNYSEIFFNRKSGYFLNENIEFMSRNRIKNDEPNFTESVMCQIEFYDILNNIINFFVDISQIRNLTELMVSHLSYSIFLLSEGEYSMCSILELFYNNMVSFPVVMMSSLEEKLKNLINDFENLDKHIYLYSFIKKNMLIYFLLILFLIIVYSFVIMIQINLVMKNEKVALSFFSSKERLECLLFQKVEKSWDVLTLFMKPEINEFLQLRNYEDIIDELIQSNEKSTYDLLFDDSKQSKKEMLLSIDSKSENSSIGEFEENYEDAVNEQGVNLNPFFTISSPLLISSEDNKSDQNINNSESTSSIETNANNSEKKLEKERKQLQDREMLLNMVNCAVTETEKVAKTSWLITFSFINSPWIVVIFSMIFLIYPIYFHTNVEHELADSALFEGRQLYACYELIKETAHYLYNGQKNVTKFSEIHEILSSIRKPTAFIHEEYSQITDYYKREQCMQLLGITCISVSALVQEVIKSNVSTNRLTMLILPAFVLFGRTILEDDTFYQQSKYLPNVCLLSEGAFFMLVIILAIIYLAKSFIYEAVIEGFNSLFHFPELLLREDKKIVENEMNENNQDDFISHSMNVSDSNLNSMMWQIYREKNGEKLPSTVISISSLTKDGEIYSVSGNVEQIFNRSPTSFIGQKLNEIFPIVVTEGEKEDENLRQFFMPDLTKKVFHFSTVNKDGWMNLTLMIETKSSHSHKSYKEESITEKLMNFVPTFFAKSLGSNCAQNFEFTNPILLYVRFDSNLPQMSLEQYFTVINNSIMNFSSIKAIVADGGLFIFTTIKPVNPIIPFLFARDLIEESKFPKRGKATNGTYSIMLAEAECVTARICSGDNNEEPFLKTNLVDDADSKNKEKILFDLKKEQICFERKFEGVFPGITREGEAMRKSMVDGESYDLISFSFAQYLSNLKNLI